jgi:hypothetical protein
VFLLPALPAALVLSADTSIFFQNALAALFISGYTNYAFTKLTAALRVSDDMNSSSSMLYQKTAYGAISF